MWLVFKLLISNIHSDSFSIYTYVQYSFLFLNKYLKWRCCEIELFTLISLWDLRTRRSNWAARLGALMRLLERHLLPTQILQKILKQSFQPRQLTDRRKKMEGHIVGTGVSVPSPLRPCVLVRLAYDGHRWIGGQSRIERKQREDPLCLLWLQQSISLKTLPLLSL